MSSYEVVREYCGWNVYPNETTTWTLDGSGTEVMLVPSLYLSAVTSVIEDGTELLEGAGFTWSEAGIIEKTCGRFTCKRRGVTVTAVTGFDSLPSIIEQVINDLDDRADVTPGVYAQVGQVRLATSSDGSPLGSGLTGAQRAVLDRYKLPPRP